eukprot:TRINITY_DN2483_c0_g3_i1.p1 TRINITY_DN2483_c0_g3~~TRINITY_DN2483_c0_g3_i1.p1  ORF type:complete len:912 (+),score=234.34 TRINITY_DN2483_c0_g3_i1:62-2737(+)
MRLRRHSTAHLLGLAYTLRDTSAPAGAQVIEEADANSPCACCVSDDEDNVFFHVEEVDTAPPPPPSPPAEASAHRYKRRGDAASPAPRKRRKTTAADNAADPGKKSKKPPKTDKPPPMRTNFRYAGIRQKRSWGSRKGFSTKYNGDDAAAAAAATAAEQGTCEIFDDAVDDSSAAAFNTHPAPAFPPPLPPSNLQRHGPVDTELLNETARRVFGFETLRDWQVAGMLRVCSGQSALVVAPTGAGKSLCYQLPALLMEPTHVVLVVTPLLALIADQLHNLPEALAGATLNSHTSAPESRRICDEVRQHRVRVLFVAPERVVTPSFAALARTLPPIDFACVDEAHCISEWSHNFRPCYLRLNRALRDDLGVRCVLGLTATATRRTEQEICQLLDIPKDGVVQANTGIPRHIHLSCSEDLDRHTALLHLLKTPAFTHAVIVYCSTHWQADELASLLQCENINCQSYHAGKTPTERKRIQTAFTDNKIDIIVATVAFGMGINKNDVRGVVHYNMPRSVENYVQEVGRAGRDGTDAYCHAFVGDDEYTRLRNLTFAEGVDDSVLTQLVTYIFHPPGVSKDVAVERQYVSINVEEEKMQFDMKSEVLTTVLTYLAQQGYIQILDVFFSKCRLNFFKTSPDMLCQTWPLAESLWRLSKLSKKSTSKSRWGRGRAGGRPAAATADAAGPAAPGREFEFATVANATGKGISDIISELRIFGAQGEVSYECADKALFVALLRPCDDLAALVDQLAAKMHALTLSMANKVTALFNVLHACSLPTVKTDALDQSHDDPLHNACQEYLRACDTETASTLADDAQADSKAAMLTCDVRAFLFQFGEEVTSPHALARIFQGIPCKAFPQERWETNSFWSRHAAEDFLRVVRVAAAEMERRKQAQPQ